MVGISDARSSHCGSTSVQSTAMRWQQLLPFDDRPRAALYAGVVLAEKEPAGLELLWPRSRLDVTPPFLCCRERSKERLAAGRGQTIWSGIVATSSSSRDRSASASLEPPAAPRDRLTNDVLLYLLQGGSPEASLRTFAAAVGVSHSLLLYHFGSTTGLLAAVHLACEQREREHLAGLTSNGDAARDPVRLMRRMWRHLALPEMWPVYRLGFALRVRADVTTQAQDKERDDWAEALQPVIRSLGVPPASLRDEALLWIGTCRGLLWELVTGADPRRVDRAAERFFSRYQQV